MEFHHSLINTDPDLGYKNDIDMLDLFREAGLVHLRTNKMPANNLAFIIKNLELIYKNYYKSAISLGMPLSPTSPINALKNLYLFFFHISCKNELCLSLSIGPFFQPMNWMKNMLDAVNNCWSIFTLNIYYSL